MSALPDSLFTRAQARELDRRAAAMGGLAPDELMRRAGSAAYRLLTTQWPEARTIAILCGAGNNAGDGYVVAARALADGRTANVVALGHPGRLPDIAAAMRSEFLARGGQETRFDGALPVADLYVDALFGIGLDRPLEGGWLQAVEALNRSGRPILALDIPSGLDADTGGEMGAAVRASVTLTFIVLKAGLVTGAGPGCCGLLRFDDLGIPPNLGADMPVRARCLGLSDARLPRRAKDSHKGDFGHVLLVGGGPGLGGAVRLAAEAALRSGAGLVSVATHPEHVTSLLAGLPEAMTRGVTIADDLEPLLARATVIAAGPGLGQGPWARELFERLLESPLPLVLDADALNLLATRPMTRKQWILTPHPGEAARLLGSTTAQVQCDRYGCAENIAAEYEAVVILKGAGSLVAAPGETTAVCLAGNPGMAAPGMGDVLTGIVAALVAQGLSLSSAARSGVLLHALAGDLAARAGERGLMARDLLAELRRVMNG